MPFWRKLAGTFFGDLFPGAISYGEECQYMTPEPVCQLMASMTTDLADEQGRSGRVLDPCCGSGRMLLAVAERKPHWDFIGQDIDLRCVRMTVLNLALRNLYGHVIWGDTLLNQKRLVYRTGFNLRCVVQEITLEDCPAPVQSAAIQVPLPSPPTTPDDAAFPGRDDKPAPPGKQQHLF